jgi:hypothetical protein
MENLNGMEWSGMKNIPWNINNMEWNRSALLMIN